MLLISFPDAISHEKAMMIKIFDAIIAVTAMRGKRRSHNFTSLTVSLLQQISCFWFLLIIILDLLQLDFDAQLRMLFLVLISFLMMN